jgi:NADP-dependent 3-hydroxy acid dehydrogenase YdfG
MDNGYRDRVVVITGASAGIGAALAVELGRRGAKLSLTARRAELLHEVADRTGGGLTIPADVTVREEVERVCKATLAEFGKIDVWVNNVGRAMTRTVEKVDAEGMDVMMNVNLKTALFGMQTIMPHFRERGSGVLANVSSMLGRIPYSTRVAPYSAAKAALNSLTESLRFELAQEYPEIRVVTVFPGPVATDFGANAIGEPYDSHKLPGAQSAEEVARIIADGLLSGPVDVYTPDNGHERALEHVRRLGSEG